MTPIPGPLVNDSDFRLQLPPPSERIFRARTPTRRLVEFTWSIIWKVVCRGSPQWAWSWRRLWLRAFGASIGPGVRLHRSAVVLFPWNLTIARRATVAHQAILNCLGPVRIGEEVHIGQYTHVCTTTHDYLDPTMKIIARPIVIGERSWIAADCFIAPGVRIGREAIVGPRSGVFHDVPDGARVAGDNARPETERSPEELAL